MLHVGDGGPAFRCCCFRVGHFYAWQIFAIIALHALLTTSYVRTAPSSPHHSPELLTEVDGGARVPSCPLPRNRAHPWWPISSVVPPLNEGYCKGEKDVCPSIFLSLERVVEGIREVFPDAMSNFCVNIGAREGMEADPVYPILDAIPDIGGVFIEANEYEFGRLKGNYDSRFPNAQTVNAFISPSNAAIVSRGDVARARSAGVYPTQRRTLDVLKIDIDGCDCHILETLLAEADGFFEAKVIQIELNHVIPPPLVWKDMCPRDVSGRSSKSLDVWGCSMQAAYDVVQPLGYELLQYDWPDAVFVKSSFARAAFPCILTAGASAGETFDRAFWVGWTHAEAHYARFVKDQDDRAFFASFPTLARRAYHDPHAVLRLIVDKMAPVLEKRPLLVEVGVTLGGARISGTVTNTSVEFNRAELGALLTFRE